MNVKTFIDKPILAGVISIMILLIGSICLIALPIEQFPSIAPPTISVSATYTGANAETVLKSVVVPLEEAINGTEKMTYMVSSATNSGLARIEIYFEQGTDPNMAHVNVQNRISQAQGKLPQDVTKGGVTVRRRQTSTLIQLGLYSPNLTYDNTFINNYFKINIEPLISRVEGVGEVNIYGADYAMRIWLKPDKMQAYKLVPRDISAALDEQNVEYATGTLGEDSENTFQYVLKYRGRYEHEQDFENIVIKSLPDGSVLKIKDIADVEIGAQKYNITAEVNGLPGASCSVSQTPGSNANATIIKIHKVLEQVRESLPPDLELVILQDTKDFVDASISEVVKTLIIAILLVVLVIFVFLQDIRATIIPTITIIVSLIGTFIFLYVFGFTINTLTLFALVLVIGTVVDDAIVVVEAVQAKFQEGETSPYRASVFAMRGIAMTLITTSLVFMAVFIPVCFMSGTTGVFYRQFGITMAVAVCLSTLNALTLSPMLCSVLMKKENSNNFTRNLRKWFNKYFGKLQKSYVNGINNFISHKILAIVLTIFALGIFGYLVYNTKTGLVPAEDMGSITVSEQTAAGSSKSETEKVMQQIDERIKDIPEIRVYSKVIGTGRNSGQGASYGQFVIKLKPWNERKDPSQSQEAVIQKIYKLTSDIKDAKIMASGQPMIAGYGTSNGFEFYIQDKQGGSIEDLNNYTKEIIKALEQRPEIARVQTSFDTKYPMYRLDVDATRCKMNGVSPSDVLSVLSGYIGGNYASNFNRFSKLYRVIIQAKPEYRLDEESLEKIYVKTSGGAMSPVSQYITLKKIYGSESLTRFNLFDAIKVNGNPADGYSSGEAINAIKQVAKEILPEGYSYEFSGMSREEEEGNATTTAMVFAACIVFIYLILCALYESICIPFAVIFSVPFGLMGSFLFAKIFGIENNIYMQTGVIMLIGLLAKTAILLTEYASQNRDKKMSITDAALDASRVRLRPILMTSLTMIFGLLPMVFASGAGANGNMSLGVGTVGGMLIGTVSLLFIVPVLFTICQKIQEKLPKRQIEDI
ncbi:MAG: efflux RND transporter permease subunit [Bacteroidales bacterium]|nr:efflux RND transporter permease subunit [Bacteroidales bacterium]